MSNTTPEQEAAANPPEHDPAGTSAVAIGVPGPTQRWRGRPLLVAGVVAALAAVALWAVLFRPSSPGAQLDNAQLSQLVFVNEDGSQGTLADYEGKPLVVNFFASWCAPCRAEMPDLEATYRSADGQVAFLGINADLTEETWHAFVAESAVTYPTVFQPNQEIWEALGLSFMPSTILIEPDGTVAHTYTGILDEATLRDLIADHLQVRL